MSKIELETKGLFGCALIVLAYTYIQAALTVGTITSVLGELLPNPTFALYTEAASGMPGFAEALTWFFMLLIQTLIGFFTATIGLRIIRAKSQLPRAHVHDFVYWGKCGQLLFACGIQSSEH